VDDACKPVGSSFSVATAIDPIDHRADGNSIRVWRLLIVAHNIKESLCTLGILAHRLNFEARKDGKRV
jgi:hypothetical protein